MENVTFSVEQAMTAHVPMCVVCGEKEVHIVVNSAGSGFCSTRCETIANEEDAAKEHFDSLLDRQYDYDEERKLDGGREVAGCYDDFLSQYDEPDMDIYAGNYSEE